MEIRRSATAREGARDNPRFECGKGLEVTMEDGTEYTMLNEEKWKWEMEDEGLVVGSDLAPFSEDGLR